MLRELMGKFVKKALPVDDELSTLTALIATTADIVNKVETGKYSIACGITGIMKMATVCRVTIEDNNIRAKMDAYYKDVSTMNSVDEFVEWGKPFTYFNTEMTKVMNNYNLGLYDWAGDATKVFLEQITKGEKYE